MAIEFTELGSICDAQLPYILIFDRNDYPQLVREIEDLPDGYRNEVAKAAKATFQQNLHISERRGFRIWKSVRDYEYSIASEVWYRDAEFGEVFYNGYVYAPSWGKLTMEAFDEFLGVAEGVM